MVGAVIPGYYYAFEIIIRCSENEWSRRVYNTNTLYYCLRDKRKTKHRRHLTTIYLGHSLSLSLSLQYNSKIKPIKKMGYTHFIHYIIHNNNILWEPKLILGSNKCKLFLIFNSCNGYSWYLIKNIIWFMLTSADNDWNSRGILHVCNK